MADDCDDIDTLLNEVENKYLCGGSEKTKAKAKAKPAATSAGSAGGRADELSEAIREICDVSNDIKLEGGGRAVAPALPQGAGVSRKCFPLFVGGTGCPTGISTSLHSYCCDALRCVECDFKVVFFDNFVWHHSVDYLFLRNYVPDFDKLRVKLVPKPLWRAYACQCKWTSALDLVNLTVSHSDFKWMCATH